MLNEGGTTFFIAPHPALCASLQVSVGDLSELARPTLFALSALASAWVFRDARGRDGFGRAAAWAWPLLTLALPAAVLPLYLAARLYTSRPPDPDEEAGQPPAPRRLAPTLLYAAALAAGGAAYFYADYRSFDAHLARAERAKLYRRPEAAVREYRAALRLREDARTRQLLGVELLLAGRGEEALGELRAAARGGGAGEGLAFDAASALEALGRRDEAAAEYRRFLEGGGCRPPAHADAARCERARGRLGALAGAAGRLP